METRVSLAAVGAFVVVLAVTGVGLLLWLASGRLSQKTYDTYVTYSKESVAGLNLHAPVKYRGVEVGSVREIGLDETDPERVRLVLEVERGTPVRTDTVAVLTSQGLTGIVFVDLGGGSRAAPPLQAGPGQPYPVIPSGPSLLRRLDTGASALLADLDRVVVHLDEVLDDGTRASLRGMAADLRQVTAALAHRAGDLDAGLAATAGTARHLEEASARLASLVERLTLAGEAVERMAGEVGQAGAQARRTMEVAGRAADGASGSVERLGAETLPELQRALGEVRQAAASLGRLSRELERDPSALVMGRRPAPLGPGE